MSQGSKVNTMKKVAFGLPVVLGLGSAFAQQQSGMTTYADADAAITAIGTVASSAFNTFSPSSFYYQDLFKSFLSCSVLPHPCQFQLSPLDPRSAPGVSV